MKQKTMNQSASYEPVALSDEASVDFSKRTDQGGTIILGKVEKGGSEAGTVVYNSKDGFLNTSLKPLATLTADEVKAFFEAVPTCISEILAE